MTDKAEATKRSIPILFSKAGRPKLLSPTSIAILKKATAKDNRIILNSGQLPREVFTEIKSAFGKLNVQWKGSGTNADGSPKGYLEIDDRFDAQVLLNAMIENKAYPSTNATDFFPTPTKVTADSVKYYAEKYRYRDVLDVLEPSAGVGGFADEVQRQFNNAKLDCVEYLPVNANVLRSKGHHVVHEGDFLQWETDKRYDLIFMNPPFDGTAYIDHIYKAWSLLKSHGDMVAIVPKTDHREDEKTKNFWGFVGCSGNVETEHDSNTFENTKIVTVELHFNNNPDANSIPHGGYKNYSVWHTVLILENNLNYDMYDGFQGQLYKIYKRNIKNEAVAKQMESGNLNAIRNDVWELVEKGRKILQRKGQYLCLNDGNKEDVIDGVLLDFEQFLFDNEDLAEYIPKTYKRIVGKLPDDFVGDDTLQTPYQIDYQNHLKKHGNSSGFDTTESLKKVGLDDLIPTVKRYGRRFLAIKPIDDLTADFEIFLDTDTCSRFIAANKKYYGILVSKNGFQYFEVDSNSGCRKQIMDYLNIEESEAKWITPLQPLAVQLEEVVTVMRGSLK